jgi:O-acetyl-ADP-ribose deacetylase (regulator of RNase III)
LRHNFVCFELLKPGKMILRTIAGMVQMTTKKVYSTVFKLALGDITKANVEAIINDAHPDLKPHRGPCKAIHEAGGSFFAGECQRVIDHQGALDAAQACVTDGGLLRAKYVIHAVGPKWNGGNSDEESLLVHTYENALKVAADYGIKTVAITPLAIGDLARYPVEKSALVAISAIEEFCRVDERLKEIQLIIADPFVHSVFQKAMAY